MARQIHSRFKVTGILVAQSPLHVGGLGGNVEVDLALAVNGQGEYYIPGTSMAGALRASMAALGKQAVNHLWGFQGTNSQGESEGHASFVLVEDAPIRLQPGAVIEVRDGVGINRYWGTAAERMKYDRTILPRGSKIPLNITLERDGDGKLSEQSWEEYKLHFIQLLEALQRGEIHLGAAKTRGLGRVKLKNVEILEQQLLDREGMLTTLLRGGSQVNLEEWQSANGSIAQPPKLTVEIHWKPCGPVMVKAEGEGIAVDILPLVSGIESTVAFVLPGSSIKGSLRSQAERIVRTVCSSQTLDADDFLTQVQVPLVKTLFGSAAKIEQGKQLGYLGALSIDDCYANIPITPEKWAAVEAATNSNQLREALDNTNLPNTQQAFHVAVDRWTGGAADGFLYSVLEPIGVTWQPIHLTLDLARLSNKKDDEPFAEYLPNIALFLLVLRDLMQCRIPIGFGSNRGMGAIEVEKIIIQGHGQLDSLAPLKNVTLTNSSFSELDGTLLETLNLAWNTWIKKQRGNNG